MSFPVQFLNRTNSNFQFPVSQFFPIFKFQISNFDLWVNQFPISNFDQFESINFPISKFPISTFGSINFQFPISNSKFPNFKFPISNIKISKFSNSNFDPFGHPIPISVISSCERPFVQGEFKGARSFRMLSFVHLAPFQGEFEGTRVYVNRLQNKFPISYKEPLVQGELRRKFAFLVTTISY